MESIVVGFDGTGASTIALDWAAERAARGVTRVEIVMVAGMVLSDDFRIDTSLGDAERRVRARAPEAEIIARRIPGRLPDALLDQASTADLLVVGAHRNRPRRSMLTGWLPLRLASRSRTPVTIVPDDWSPASGPVVVGLDDDASSRGAVAAAAAEAEATETGLMIVHAWQMPVPRVEGSVALLASPIQVKAEHRRILREAIGAVAAAHPGLAVEEVLVRENPAAALLHRAADASLLVIGTHRRGVLARTLLGSVAQSVLPQSSVPVCVVPYDIDA